VVTNLYPEHIDWHGDVERYFADKLKLLEYAQIKILNAQNPTLNSRVRDDAIQYFNDKNSYHVDGNHLYHQQQSLLALDDIQLIGSHNLENIAAVLMVCDALQLEQQKVLQSIKQFKPLAHRLQSLGKIGKHFAINDSIATTPMATIAALKTIDLHNSTLLIGGYDRGHDWSGFVADLIENSPQLIIISGQNADLIYALFEKLDSTCQYIKCATLDDSIQYAVEHTPENGLILLSPGAPSFDQFESYIKRGLFFEQEMKKYA
jgi:UDP-N-acetylmuramoylalanine--D-glutamate ligase